MGAWGPGTFDDDLARDWLEDLHDSDPVAFLRHCLDLSDAPDRGHLACVGVVCSAEIIHGLTCEPRPGLPELAEDWLKEHRLIDASSLIPDAIHGLGQVVSPGSGMQQMWADEPELYPDWIDQIEDLVRRLEAALFRGG